MNIHNFKEYIENGNNFIFLKIGDGEINSMRFKEGDTVPHNKKEIPFYEATNVDDHRYSFSLGLDNRDGYKYLVESVSFIANWFSTNPPKNENGRINLNFFNNFNIENNLNPNFISPFEILMIQKNKLSDKSLLEFYKTIANSKRKKIYVGPERLKGICNYLKIDDYITIPLVNAYDEKDKIYENIKDVLSDDCIILFSVGLQSPGLISDLHKFKNNITLLDIGSGFDSLLVGKTRWGQPTIEESKNNYKELLW
jgi:hypothetical protein